MVYSLISFCGDGLLLAAVKDIEEGDNAEWLLDQACTGPLDRLMAREVEQQDGAPLTWQQVAMNGAAASAVGAAASAAAAAAFAAAGHLVVLTGS